MKHRAMLFAMLCLAVTAQAQEWNYHMHQGDRLVYEEANTLKTSIIEIHGKYAGYEIENGDPVDTAWATPYINMIPPYFAGLTGGCVIDMRFQSIDTTGVVYQEGAHEFGDIEMFPTFIPPTDTLLLQNKQWSAGPDLTYNYRAFDTVVCGADVRAISFIRERGDTLTEMTVSEIFGIVRIYNEYEEWRLMSAVIAGVKYNRDMRKFAAHPTCAGSEFYYEIYYPEFATSAMTVNERIILRDTLINGTTYYKPGGMLWQYTGALPYRVIDGIVYVYDNGQERMLDSTVSIGTRVSGGMIGDTGTVIVNGIARRYITTVWNFGSKTWVEGIGMTHDESSPMWDAGHNKRLIYAIICGERYEFRSPAELAWSKQSGDVRVYKNESRGERITNTFLNLPESQWPGAANTDTLACISTLYQQPGEERTVYLPMLGITPRLDNRWIDRIWDMDGSVYFQRQEPYDEHGIAFLTTDPATDTLFVSVEGQQSKIYNYTEYDTTIFKIPMRAQRYNQEIGPMHYLVTAAGKYGAIRVITGDGLNADEWILTSAILNGRHFDRVQRNWGIPEICSGIEREYRIQIGGAIDTVREIARDTLIESETWYIVQTPRYYHYMTIPSNIIHTGYVYTGPGKQSHIPYGYFSLGETFWDKDGEPMVVYDTSHVVLNGKMVRTFTALHKTPESYFHRIWAENVGLYEEREWTARHGTDVTNLIYAKTCDDEFTITGIESVPAPIPVATRIFSAPYPNPVSLSQGAVQLSASQPIHGTLHLTLYDALGRSVHSASYNPPATATQHLSIPLAGVTPGVYILSIVGVRLNESKAIIVLR